MDQVQKGLSSEEEFESSEKEEVDVDSGDGPVGLATLRTPSLVLIGHTSVVICADWLHGTIIIKFKNCLLAPSQEHLIE